MVEGAFRALIPNGRSKLPSRQWLQTEQDAIDRARGSLETSPGLERVFVVQIVAVVERSKPPIEVREWREADTFTLGSGNGVERDDEDAD